MMTVSELQLLLFFLDLPLFSSIWCLVFGLCYVYFSVEIFFFIVFKHFFFFLSLLFPLLLLLVFSLSYWKFLFFPICWSILLLQSHLYLQGEQRVSVLFLFVAYKKLFILFKWREATMAPQKFSRLRPFPTISMKHWKLKSCRQNRGQVVMCCYLSHRENYLLQPYISVIQNGLLADNQYSSGRKSQADSLRRVLEFGTSLIC